MKFKFFNTKVIFWGIAAILFIIGCVNVTLTSIVSRQLKNASAYATETSAVQVMAAPKLPSEVIYRLYECGGKIGIYDAKTDILIDIIDVLASTLPKSDRLALKKGIDIYTFADLAKIIDDFSS